MKKQQIINDIMNIFSSQEKISQELNEIRAVLICNSLRGVFGDWEYDTDLDVVTNVISCLKHLIERRGN